MRLSIKPISAKAMQKGQGVQVLSREQRVDAGADLEQEKGYSESREFSAMLDNFAAYAAVPDFMADLGQDQAPRMRCDRVKEAKAANAEEEPQHSEQNAARPQDWPVLNQPPINQQTAGQDQPERLEKQSGEKRDKIPEKPEEDKETKEQTAAEPECKYSTVDQAAPQPQESEPALQTRQENQPGSAAAPLPQSASLQETASQASLVNQSLKPVQEQKENPGGQACEAAQTEQTPPVRVQAGTNEQNAKLETQISAKLPQPSQSEKEQDNNQTAGAKYLQSSPEMIGQAQAAQPDHEESADLADLIQSKFQTASVAEPSQERAKDSQLVKQAPPPVNFMPQQEARATAPQDALLENVNARQAAAGQLMEKISPALMLNNQSAAKYALPSNAEARPQGSDAAAKLSKLVSTNAHSIIEKVESALKEVARSKHGKTISVRLDPPQLGALKIDMTLKEGTLHARIVPEVPQVAQYLRDHAHELQGFLRRAGIEAEQVKISVSSEKFEFKGNSNQSGGNAPQRDKNQAQSWEQSQVLGQETSAIIQAEQTVALDHWVA